jgi:hypothetical protein
MSRAVEGAKRAAPAAGALAAGALTSLGVLVLTGTVAAASPRAPLPRAHAARTVSLRERGHLHLTSKHGFTLNEEGSASGTINGTIYIHLRISSNSSVTAEVNIYPSGGSLTGHGSASYHINGSYASFSGSLSIARGTGTYSRAHASGLQFTGKIRRRNDAVSVQLNGPLSY